MTQAVPLEVPLKVDTAIGQAGWQRKDRLHEDRTMTNEQWQMLLDVIAQAGVWSRFRQVLLLTVLAARLGGRFRGLFYERSNLV